MDRKYQSCVLFTSMQQTDKKTNRKQRKKETNPQPQERFVIFKLYLVCGCMKSLQTKSVTVLLYTSSEFQVADCRHLEFFLFETVAEIKCIKSKSCTQMKMAIRCFLELL